MKAAWAFVVFCLASSAGYLFNDLIDLEADRCHPTKRDRALASGRLSVGDARNCAVAMATVAILASLLLGLGFLAVTVGYLALTVAYTTLFKRIFLLDMVAIACAFVLRSVAGAVAIRVPISPWLYILTILIALFLVLGKRRNESARVDSSDRLESHGASYALGFLDRMTEIVVVATFGSYCAYTVLSRSLPSDHAMILTIPFVGFGLGRYLFLVRRRKLGSSPEEVLLQDRPIILDVGVWLVSTLGLLYVIK